MSSLVITVLMFVYCIISLIVWGIVWGIEKDAGLSSIICIFWPVLLPTGLLVWFLYLLVKLGIKIGESIFKD